MAESNADRSQPLKDVLTGEQIEFLREQSDVGNLDEVLNSTLNEIMKSASKPDLTELMGRATGQMTSAPESRPEPDHS